jgi:hypothetical protein
MKFRKIETAWILRAGPSARRLRPVGVRDGTRIQCISVTPHHRAPVFALLFTGGSLSRSLPGTALPARLNRYNSAVLAPRIAVPPGFCR